MKAKAVKSNLSQLVSKTVYNYLRTSANTGSLYVGVGFPDRDWWNTYTGGQDSDSTEFKGGDSDDFDPSDAFFYSQNTSFLHKIYNGGISRVIAREDWTQNNTYGAWPSKKSHVLVKQYSMGAVRYNVYRCLFSTGLGSSVAPNSTLIDPFTTADGYVWKYLYTLDETTVTRFLNQNWLPVPEPITREEFEGMTPGTLRYNRYVYQVNAQGGTVYSIDNVPAGFSGTLTVEDLSGTATQQCQVLFAGGVGTLIQPGLNYTGPVRVVGGAPGATANIAPGLGHGSDLPQEMEANAVMVVVRVVPEGKLADIIEGSVYNFTSLIADPIDQTTKRLATKDYYLACRSFTTSNVYSVGDDVSFGDKRIKIVANDGDRYFYVGYVDPNVTEEAVLTNADGGGIIETFDREIVYNSGSLLMVDWRESEITRTAGQIETFQFVMKF